MTKKSKLSIILLTLFLSFCCLFVGSYFVYADKGDIGSKVAITDVYMEKGASIRYGTMEREMGLRFTMLIKSSDYESIKDDVSFGMFLLPKDYVDIHPLETDLSYYYWKNESGYNVDENDNILNSTSGRAFVVNFTNVNLKINDLYSVNEMMSFSGVLTSIKDGSDWNNFNLNRDFVGVGYIKYLDNSDNVTYKFANKVYSENNGKAEIKDFSYDYCSRNVGYISQLAIEDLMSNISIRKSLLPGSSEAETAQINEEIATLSSRINTLNHGYLGKINGFYNEVSESGVVNEEITYASREELDGNGNPTGNFAKYPSLKTTYTINYYFENENGQFVLNQAKSVTISDNVGKTVTADIPMFDGYVFDVGNINNLISSKLYVNKTVLSVYYRIAGFVVTFYNYDNSVFNSQKVKSGENVIIPSSPTKQNYTFVYWEKDGVRFDFGTPIYADTDIYPVFLENIYVKHTSNFYYWHSTEEKFGTMTFGEFCYGKNTLAKGTILNNKPYCTFSANWELNLSSNDVQSLLNAGFDKFAFYIYLDANYEPINVSVVNNSNIFSLSANKWEKIVVDLSLLLSFEGNLIRISDYSRAGDTFSLAIADASVYKYTVPTEMELKDSSALVEYCANGPDNGNGILTENSLVDGVVTKATFSKSTTNTEYGTTTSSANFRYSIDSDDIDHLIDAGFNYVEMQVYFGAVPNKQGVTVDSLDIATLNDTDTRQAYSANKWLTFYFELDEFEAVLDSGFTFRIWLPVAGNGDYNGTYSVSIGKISFVNEITLSEFAILDNSSLYEYCSNGPDSGYAPKYFDSEIEGKNALVYFSKSTVNTEWGATTMTANLRYSYNSSDIDVLIGKGYNYISLYAYFGVSLNKDNVSVDEIDVATLNNDGNRDSVSVNRWISYTFALSSFKNIVSSGYTFKIWLPVAGNGDYNGTYSLAVADVEFLTNQKQTEIEFADDSFVHESCAVWNAPNQGYLPVQSNITIDNVVSTYTYSHATRDMGYGDTTISAYLKFNFTTQELQNKINSGKKYLQFDAYFGIAGTRQKIDAISVSTLNNGNNIMNCKVNTWQTFSFLISDIINVINDSGYIFRLYPITDGGESTCGTYSISVANLSLQDSRAMESICFYDNVSLYEYCSIGPDNGNANKTYFGNIGGRDTSVIFEKSTRNTEYSTTTLTLNMTFDFTSGDIDDFIDQGYSHLSVPFYFSAYGTVLPVNDVQIAVLNNDGTANTYLSNSWQNLYLDLNTLKNNMPSGYILKVWLPIRGDGKYNGSYTLALGQISLSKQFTVSFVGTSIPSKTVFYGNSLEFTNDEMEQNNIKYFTLNDKCFDIYQPIYNTLTLSAVLDETIKLNKTTTKLFYQNDYEVISSNSWNVEFENRKAAVVASFNDCENASISSDIMFNVTKQQISEWVSLGYTHIETYIYCSQNANYSVFGYKNNVQSKLSNQWNKVIIDLTTFRNYYNSNPMFIMNGVNGNVTIALAEFVLVKSPFEYISNTLVDQNRISNYKILIAENSFNDEISYAAEELANLLYESIGVKLQVVTCLSTDPSVKYISLGNTSLFDDSGLAIYNNEIGNQGYYIKTDSFNNIYIYSTSLVGVLNGVYGLLEKEFGYDYYFTDIHEINIYDFYEIDDLDYTIKPDIEYRVIGDGWNYDTTSNDSKYKLQMINYEDIFVYSPGEGGCWHNSFGYLEPAVDYSSHPKWFNVVKGKITQICYTAHGDNTEFDNMVDHVVADMVSCLQRETNKNIIAFNNMDNDSHCNCAGCSFMYNKYGTRSAAMIKFLNAVSACLEKELVKIGDERAYTFKIEFMAYWGCEYAPVTTSYDAYGNPSFTYDVSMKLNEHIIPLYASVQNWFYTKSIQDSVNASEKEALLEWAELSSNGVFLWGYDTHYADYGFMFPFDSYYCYSDLYKFAKEVGIRFIMLENQRLNEDAATGFSIIKGYLQSKLGWNVNLNVAELINKYFNAMYGSESGAMKAIFDSVDEFVYNNDVLCGHNTDLYVSYFESSNWDYSKVLSWYNGMKQCEQNLIDSGDLVSAKNVRLEILFPAFTLVRAFNKTQYQSEVNALLEEFNITAYSQLNFVE